MIIKIIKFPFLLIAVIYKQFRCKHEYTHYRNIHGDEINTFYRIKRSEWECKKCGHSEYRDDLYYGEEKV